MRLFSQRVCQVFPTHHHGFVFFTFSCGLTSSRPIFTLLSSNCIGFHFVLTFLLCAFLPSCSSLFLVWLSLHRSITSTPSISSLISLFSIQCVDTSFCSWICSSHLLCQDCFKGLQVPKIVDLNHLHDYHQIIFYRFDSRGVKPIPSIVMLLHSLTIFCCSVIFCIWYCIK